MCAGKFPLVSMGGQADRQACADGEWGPPSARAEIKVKIMKNEDAFHNLIQLFYKYNKYWIHHFNSYSYLKKLHPAFRSFHSHSRLWSRDFLPRLSARWRGRPFQCIKAYIPKDSMSMPMLKRLWHRSDFLYPPSLILNHKSSNLISPSSIINPQASILKPQSLLLNP